MWFRAISRLSERPRSRSARRDAAASRARPVRAVALGAALLVVVAGCGALDDDPAATRPVASGSPTITHTPSGDMLRIDGELVRAVLIPDPSHGALYALTDTALYHYERGHWEPTGAGNDGRWLLLDPSEPDRILRGDHPPCDGEGSGEPIPFDLSEDAGRRWRVLYQGVNIRPLAFDGSLPGVVYGSDCGLAISSSRGVKWERLRPFAGHDVVALAATGERLYVIGVSSAGVSQLRAINVTDPDQPVVGEPLLEIPGQATLDTQGDRIVVGAVDAVYLSDDAGVTWASSRIGLEQVTTPPTPAPVRPPRGGEGEEYGIQVVRIQPGNLHRIYAGAPHGLYVSQDDGVTWVRYTQVNFNASVIDIQFALDGADLYVTTTAGVIVVPAP